MKIKKKISLLSAVLMALSLPLSVNAAVIGDANNDGVFNIRDAAFIASSLAKGNALNAAADFNGDGIVNIRDAASIAKKLIDQYNPEAQQMLDLINAERAKYGISPLEFDSTMNKMADVRAKELVTLFDHVRPDGRDCFTIFSDFNTSFGCCGENIACGYSSVEGTYYQWYNSPLHYENMMDPNFTQMGLGCSGGIYWAQLFR